MPAASPAPGALRWRRLPAPRPAPLRRAAPGLSPLRRCPGPCTAREPWRRGWAGPAGLGESGELAEGAGFGAERTAAAPDLGGTGQGLPGGSAERWHCGAAAPRSRSLPLPVRKPGPRGKYRVTVCIADWFGVTPHGGVLVPGESRSGFLCGAPSASRCLLNSRLGPQNGWARARAFLGLCPLLI